MTSSFGMDGQLPTKTMSHEVEMLMLCLGQPLQGAYMRKQNVGLLEVMKERMGSIN